MVIDDGTEDAVDADLVIGADGARSTVRATVDPEHPDARYAGVLLWRTLVDETSDAARRSRCPPTASRPVRCTRAPTGW